MSGLADALLADLEGLSDGENEQEHEQQQPLASTSGIKRKHEHDDHEDSEDEQDEDDNDEHDDPSKPEIGSLVLEGGVKPADELDREDVQRMELGAIADVTTIAKLEGSKRMNDIIKVCLPLFFLKLVG